MADTPKPAVDQLLTALASDDPVERQEARDALVEVGSATLPGLLAALKDQRQHVRWEAAKTLSGIADPAARSMPRPRWHWPSN